MPVTFVRDPVTGITYSVNISGSTPTEQESARIDQFLASQRTLSVLPQAQPVEEEEIDRTAFGRGFVREPFQRERSFGVVEEALADTAFGKFFGFDAEEARAKQEAAEAELRRLELEDPSIRFEDITGLGTAASVSGEALGGEARDIAIQAGATATGAGIGGLFFGAGAVPGAAIGRTAGVAYTTAQAAPQMLAEAIEAQKEEGNEVNLTKALGATAINLLSEFVTDYFVVGKLIPKEAKSKVGSAVRSAIEAGTAEGATEVFQQAVIRGQAGQDLTSPEAIAEYAESLYSGMTVGGTIGGVGGFLSTPDRSAEKELDDDLKELREYGLAGFKFAEETEKDIEAQRNAALGAVGIDLDAPLQIGTDGAPLALPAPDAAEIAPKPVIADTEFENLSFNKAEYERVLQQVKADITRRKPQPEQAEVDVPSSEPLSKPVSNPINIPAIHQRVKADIPGITVSKVRDIMKDLQARGFVAENPASKKNKFIPMGSLTPEVKTPDVSYRRQIDSAADFIKADQTRLERLQYDLRSAEAYGRDLEGNRVTPNQVNATIARVEQRIAQRQQRIELANQRLQSLGQDTHVPRIEKVGIPPSLKAVPVAEGTPDALRPRFEAQQAGIRGMKEQVSSLNKQVRKLNEQAKKRTLSSNELDRMQKLQQQQAELSKRLGEAQANLKAPEKIVQEAKGEQFREQERQREIERKLAAARARAAADQVKAQEDQGVSPVTPAFNAKQTRVFDALKKRLSNLGLKDVKLEGVQKIEGGEGFFDPVTKTITLAMGMYDPNMNDQQLFDAISEVMNHEVIHALRAMGVLKPNEMKVLERLAEKTKYVKRTKDGTQKRNYTYLDRAKSLYSDYTPTQQKEEAIAEMFRDYIAGRLKLGGGPRALFEKIKKFFKSLIGANVDNGFNSVEDIFQGIRRGEIGARDRPVLAEPVPTDVAVPAPPQTMLSRLPTLPMAPDGTRAHQLPSQLLMRGTGAAPLVNMTQKYTPGNAAANNAAIQQILDQYPNAMSSEREWAEAMQASFGGDFIPVPPMVGLQYAQSPEKMAEKLRKLTPELKKGVDKGFEYVKKIRDVYNSGNASPRMTLKLFIWGILSRGAGPVQQESAFIDIIDNAYPIIQKATRQPLTEDDIDMWMTTVSRSIPEGSPGKQVTMNVNAAANLVRAMSQLMPGSNQTVLGAVHDAMSDPNANPADIRQFFLSNTQGAGIDNKVLSFILLVGGKDDVLVMDRIQGRHLWDDGRFGGANIYDGIGKQKAGLNGIFRGPYGILTTRILENGLRQNVSRAYELIGRPEDASLGRFHWETWVIEGEQVVSHDTLAAVFNDSSIGQSVTEGKTDTLSSGMTYRRGEISTVVEYPLSNGDVVYMKPERFKKFTTALADDAKKAKSSTGVFKEGKFKVTARADIPWFDRPDVDRGALDKMAREYENARPDGSVLVGTERARDGQDASQRGNSDLDKRYSRLPTDEVRPERGGDKRDGRPARSLAPLEGGPIVEGATGPDEELVSVAEKYARDNGIDLRRQAEFVKVDEARAKRIADAYEAMEDRPQDPEVREAYDNLIRQTRAQYDALVDAGYEFTFFDKETDPYSGDPWAAMIDLRNNKRMAVYGTYAGYGSEGMPATAAAGNPLLQDTGLRWPDQRGVEQIVTPNDLFRAVHDAFGHSIEGAGFRARGEENAWQAHVRLFTGSAIPALTSETRGQNSWLNYGPFGEKNRTASVEDTIFAPQKIGLMPSFTWTEGRAGDGRPYKEVNADSRRMLSRLYSTTAPSQGTPQFGPSDLETAMQNMRYAGVQDKFASIFKKIGKPFKVDEKAIEDGTQWLVNKLQDNFVSVGKMYDALRKQGANIPRDMDAYFQELLLHGVTGAKKTNFKAEEFTPIVERVARLNVTDTERDALKRVSGYYDQILEKTGNKSHALTNAYLYALHALERNQRISDLSKGQITNGSGMSNQEAQNIIAFVNGMGAQRAGELRNIAAAVQGMISGTNDTYIEGGLIPDYKGDTDIDDETRKAFTKYKNYVPLRGFADPESNLDESAGGFSTTNRFGALGSPNKKALGRESYAGDILANVAVQRENAIDKAERNKVGVALLNLLESDVNTDAYAEVLLRHPLRRVMRNGRITIMPDRDFSNPNLPVLAVRRGGEEILIGFKDPRLAAAFKGTSAKQMNAVMNGLHSFTRVYANLLTSWNPAFLLGNWPKDIETALFNAQQYDMEGSSKDIIKNVRPSFKAIMKVLNNKEGGDPYWLNRYKQFYDNGGQNVLNQMGDVVNNSKDIRDTISKIVAADDAGNRILTKTLWTSTKKGVGSLANYVEAVNSAVENSTRLAFFDAVVRNLEAQGVPTERAVREAAAAARQLTTNFGKGGEMKTAFNTFYLFFNASLQGSMAIFTSLVNNPKGRKLVAGVITAGFIMELLNGAISDDEDDDGIKDYDNLGDYVLSHNIILPDLNGDGTFNRVPLAYGINMFYNFGRVMGNIARGAMGDGGTYTPQEAAASTVGTVVESFNPFGGNNFWTFLAPTQLDLPVELLTNRNFMDGPIYKELSPFEQNKSRSALYWSTTSPSAIWTSKFINDTIGRGSDIIPGEVLGKRVDIQPDVIEHVIDFMLGGAGKFVLQMGEASTTFVPAAIMGDFERDMIRRTPILNKFITAVTEKDRSGDFYEKRDDVLVVYADLKDAIENGDTERALAIRERYAEYLPLIGPIRAISNEIKKLNKLRRNVNANANLSQERKREILDKIEERLALFVSRGNQLMLSI
jgi:hypothetical protein